MTTRVLVDLGLRTKSGPRVRAGLLPALTAEWSERGWPLHVVVPEESGGEVAPPTRADLIRQPARSDLFLEEAWLPRLWRQFDVVITQRECVRPVNGRAKVVLQLHEHVSTRYAPTASVRAALRLGLQRLRTSQTYALADHVCFSSHWTRERFIQLEGEPRRSSVVHLAGWPDDERPETPSRPQPPPYLLAVASNDVRDDLDWGLRVWEELRQSGGSGGLHELHVVGNVPPRAVPGVTFLGRLDEDSLRRHLAGAAAYLHLGRAEGFGLSLVESLQLGVPVVAMAGSATDEVAARGGAVVRTVAEASAAVARSVSSDRARRDALDGGRMFSWRSTACGWADAVDPLVGGSA